MATIRDRKTLAPNQNGADQLWFSGAALTGLLHPEARGPSPLYAPPVANDDNYSTTDSTVLTGNVLGNDTPGDVPLAITAVNGSGLAVDREIVLPSGARLRVNADGSFTYNPNGAFDAIPTTDDSFTYTVAGGDTATVIVQVQDVPVPGIITGTDGPDTLNGTPTDDVINGLGGDDAINGLGGNDTIDGGTGLDAMSGGAGNDIYWIDNAGDTIAELDGEGYDIAITTVNYTLGAGVHVEELALPASQANGRILHGNELDNIIRGGIGIDQLFGHAGNDVLHAGNANQFGAYSSGTYVGGSGDDIYYVFANSLDAVTELAGEGYDIVYVGGSAFSPNSAEIELIAPNPDAPRGGGFTIFAGSAATEIHGTAFADILYSGGGIDTMIGNGGNDTYVIDQLDDVIVEAADGGLHDTIHTTINFTLSEGGNIEDLIGIAASASMSLEGNSFDNLITSQSSGADIIVGHDGNDTLKGGNGNDSLYGDNGNDILDGQAGADLMDGGLGADTYFVNTVSDTVIETNIEAGQTYFDGDKIVTTVSYTLAAGQQIEGLFAAPAGGISFTLIGNEFGNYIVAVSQALVSDILIGNDGDDRLDGGSRADTMDGGLGDDIFYVDQFDDVVIERAGEGRDTIYTRTNYTLAEGVHVEGIAVRDKESDAHFQITGNSFAQEIYGNIAQNTFRGGGGADTIIGYAGDDTYYVQSGTETFIEVVGEGRDIVVTGQSYVLAAGQSIDVLSVENIAATDALNLVGNELAQEIYGNNGANILRGGGGADFILGFGGDDIYYVASGAETFLETAGNGRDIVYANQSYTLAAGQSIEVLSVESIADTVAFNLVGNELAQEIYGNNGANILRGGGGADYLLGFGGNDTYYVTSGLETFLETAGQGRDTVYTELSHILASGSEIEVLSAISFGDTTAINLTGNELGQEIYGNAGANVLDGKGGNDALMGNGGADIFQFTTAPGAGNVDHVLDFTTASDKLALDDAIFAGIGTPGAFNANAFFAGTAAHDADDRIIYDQATGTLSYDADGNGAGAAIAFAILQPGTSLVVGDFQVI